MGLDFMEDRLFHGRKVRLMTLEDRFSREGIALETAFSIPSRRVVRELDAVAAIRGYPQRLRIDNELSAFFKEFEANSIVARR